MEITAKLLIVEDERIVAEDIKSSLKKLGYEVVAVVSSGEDALEILKKQKPDLILMDIVLKTSMTGIETAEKIKQKYRIPVIYLTAYADRTTLDRAKVTEPFGYILKPFDERELHSSIEMVLYKYRMEQKMRTSNAWFSTIIKSIGDGVIVTDLERSITFMNSIAEYLTGWKQEEALGRQLFDVFRVIDEATGKKLESMVDRALEEGTVVNLPTRSKMITREGSEIPIDDSVAPVRDEKGGIVGVVLVFHDIVERRLVEEALQESEERYRTLFEDSRDAIYVTTRQGDFVMANQAALSLFGLEKATITQENIRDRFKDRQAWETFRKTIEGNGDVRDFEFKVITTSGQERDCLLSATERRDSENILIGIQSIIRDITESKLAQLEKEKIQEQLLHAQKMEAVGILAGGVAHDFNNLLTVIQGNADLLMLKLDSDSSLYQEVEEIHTASIRAADLTRQLLMFSRKHLMEPRSIIMNELLESLAKMLNRLIGEDISIVSEFEEGLWPIWADKGTLEQVIMNMVVNARDAMPEGGTITLKTKNRVLFGEALKDLPEITPGKFTCLTISDTGCGMDEVTTTHIFEPFYSTKGPGKGTGLGLSVAYGIVQQHGGWIDVESKPGKGTSFQIFLPANLQEKKETKQSLSSSVGYRGNGETILVVEDDENVREFASRALRGNGYKVLSAINFSEAMALFKKQKDSIGMVLSDVVLPDNNGIELVGKFLLMNPALNVLLSSGYTDHKSQWSIIQKKGYPFLPKPFTLAALLKAVKDVLEAA